MYQRTLDIYINISSKFATYILECSNSFHSPFATNISYPFYIYFKPPFATYLSRHILSNVFDQSLHIAVVFQNHQFCLFSVVSRMNYLYFYRGAIIKTTPILKRSHVVTWSVNTPCDLPNATAQWDRRNVQLTSYNSV